MKLNETHKAPVKASYGRRPDLGSSDLDDADRFSRNTHKTGWRTKADWNKRGDSMGEPRMDRKFTFRIRKDTQTANREKISRSSQEMATTQTGFNKLSFATAYQEPPRERNLSAAINSKQPFREMNITDKISKQMALEKHHQQLNFANTFYNSAAHKHAAGSNEQLEAKQNNFIRTGGFAGSPRSAGLAGKGLSYKDHRGYEKPWLRGTNLEFSSTGTVAPAHQDWHKTGNGFTSKLSALKRENTVEPDSQRPTVVSRSNQPTTEVSEVKAGEGAEGDREKEKEKKRRLLNYNVGERLGKGSYAVVHLAVDVETGKKFALKSYEKEKMSSNTRKGIIENEIKVLNNINHARVVRLQKVIQTKNHVRAAHQIHILMDLAEGLILSQYYKSMRDSRLAEPDAAKIFQQIVEAVCYLHKNGIYHRDLKTENVIIDGNKKIKIIDFGFSIKAEPMQRLNLFCGTPNYMSPEIVLKKDYYGGPSDVWALGVMLFVICAGYFPFKGKSDKELHKKILGVELVFPAHFSHHLKTLISSIMQYASLSRPSPEQILEHAWFKQ